MSISIKRARRPAHWFHAARAAAAVAATTSRATATRHHQGVERRGADRGRAIRGPVRGAACRRGRRSWGRTWSAAAALRPCPALTWSRGRCGAIRSASRTGACSRPTYLVVGQRRARERAVWLCASSSSTSRPDSSCSRRSCRRRKPACERPRTAISDLVFERLTGVRGAFCDAARVRSGRRCAADAALQADRVRRRRIRSAHGRRLA